MRRVALVLLAIAAAAGQQDIPQIATLKQLLKESPDPGLIMYSIARAYAQAGKPGEALSWLQKTVSRNEGFDPSADEAFSALRDLPEFKALAEQVDKDNPPVHNSEEAFSIPEKDLIPEGLAYDPAGEKFYLGSVYKRKIIQVSDNGRHRDFAGPGQDGLGRVLGMKVDARTGTLWANSNSDKEGAVFHYDLRSRKLIKKYVLPGNHLFNDLVVNSRGDVFVTDTKMGTVYWIEHDKGSLEEFSPGLKFEEANGIALSGDERKLFVAHFSGGVAVLDIESRSARPLARPPGVTLAAIDGLYFHNGNLIAIQNGDVTPRAVRLFLNAGMDRIEGIQILERRNPQFEIPTTGVLVGDTFYYISNSQLDNYAEGKVRNPQALRPIVIMKVKL